MGGVYGINKIRKRDVGNGSWKHGMSLNQFSTSTNGEGQRDRAEKIHSNMSRRRITARSCIFIILGTFVISWFGNAEQYLVISVPERSKTVSGSNPYYGIGQKPSSIQLPKGMHNYNSLPSSSFWSDLELRKPKHISYIGNDRHKYVASDDVPLFEKHRQEIDCENIASWQSSSFPTCNKMHEFYIADNVSFLAGEGGYREVWRVSDGNDNAMALKTLRMEQDYDSYYFSKHLHRHNVDATTMERLTSSPNVVNIFSYCGNGGVYEFGDQGSLNAYRRLHNRTSINDIKYSIQAATGLADFHSIDGEGKPSIVHNDIKPQQFILIDGVFKLNDFNKAKFMLWNKEKNQKCNIANGVPKSSGTFRSPEEFSGKTLDESVDVYALGNTLYTILENKWPFAKENNKEVHKRVINGERASLSKSVLESDDKYINAIVKAIEMSQHQEVSKRSSAREIQHFLEAVFNGV